MRYFSLEFHEFLRGLHRNNTKRWFEDHREIYREFVREPFIRFVDDLIEAFRDDWPDLDTSARESIFRIHRDLRFSRDKRPYNPEAKANLSKGGRRSGNDPGFYLLFSHDRVHVGGGVYRPDRNRLHRIRTRIAMDPEAFERSVRRERFLETFGEIKGERHKRLPKEFQSIALKHPLIAHKSFWWISVLEPEVVLREDLLDVIVDHFRAAKPVHDFLSDALSGS
jgi:uncharacterized protein (TIGR02453 family)